MLYTIMYNALKVLHKHCNNDMLGILLIYPHSLLGAVHLGVVHIDWSAIVTIYQCSEIGYNAGLPSMYIYNAIDLLISTI